MKIDKVGVIGCGSMGAGIAQAAAQSGFEVIIAETKEDLLNKGLASINKILAKGVAKGKVSQEDMDKTLARINGTVGMKDLAGCDLVIEAVYEDLDLKKQIFKELDQICAEHTILATNTSCLSIIDIASVTSRPEKVLGLHFFFPVPLMKLLEIVRTIATSDEATDAAKEFGESLGKTMVVAKDTPGYIVNRLFIPYMLDAIRMYEAGVASREDIDAAVKMGLNYPMGPLSLADFTGVDIVCNVAAAMYEQTKDPAFIPPTLLQKMVTAGWLGRKVGRGFYEYN